MVLKSQTAETAQTSHGVQSMLAPSVPRSAVLLEGQQKMQQMQKIEKQHGLNALAGIGRTCRN